MYLTEAFLQNAFGAANVSRLCPSAPELATTIELAEAEIESALYMGGYESAVPSTVYATIESVPKVVKLAAYGAWLELAHGRNGITIPTEFQAYTRKIDDIRMGKLEIPNVTKVVARAVGGVSSTETSSDVANSRPPVFSREQMGGF